MPKHHGHSTVIFPLFGHANAVFKVRRGCHRGDSPGGLSKLSSTRRLAPSRGRCPRRGQAVLERTRAPAPGLVDVLDAPRGSQIRRPAPVWELPRKEVIQPHLPVRLPCYDFTPITSPTFDGSL